MFSSGLFKKLLFALIGSHLFLAAVLTLAATHWQHRQIVKLTSARLRAVAAVLRNHVNEHVARKPHGVGSGELAENKEASLQSFVKGLDLLESTRVTLVDADGVVLADSEQQPQRMLNHMNRPELGEAQQVGEGIATRRSPTLGTELVYLAVPLQADDPRSVLLRVATPVEHLQEEVAAFRTTALIGVPIATAVILCAALFIFRRLVHPLQLLSEATSAVADGKAERLETTRRFGELGFLADSIDRIQQQLLEEVRCLNSNKEQLATVLSSMDEGIIAVDADQHILLANDACFDLLDFVKGDPVGRPLLEASRNRSLYNVIQTCLQTRQPANAEFELPSTPRRALAMRATCIPGDPCPGAVVLLHDTTELRRLENLRQEFVANVSHELKTPLAAIKAYAETLRAGAIHDTDHNLGFVARIEEQADRLHDLILDMLQIARIEAGREAFELADISLKRVVEASVSHFRQAAERQRVCLAVGDSADALTARADEEGLRSILDNLIDNAIKYTPEGGTVTVSWMPAGDFVQIEVQDTGIGISAADQLRVFERFFRSDKARSRELGGTGLGLAIVKHLSLAFGGSVQLQSELGAGSRFLVSLPRS